MSDTIFLLRSRDVVEIGDAANLENMRDAEVRATARSWGAVSAACSWSTETKPWDFSEKSQQRHDEDEGVVPGAMVPDCFRTFHLHTGAYPAMEGG